MSAPRPRRQRMIAMVGAVGAALIGALVLVLTLGSGGSARPDSPGAAAAAWGRATLHHDSSALKRLSCPAATQGLGIYGLVFSGSGVRAGAPVATGAARWAVPVMSTGPGGGTSVTVTVVEQHGTFVVC